MPNVVRFTLPTARSLHVAGAGQFSAGVLDVDANNLSLVSRTRYLVKPYGAIEVGIVPAGTAYPSLPAAPAAPAADPYPQYVTDADLSNPASAPSAALRAAYVPFWKSSEAVAGGDVRMTALGITIRRNSSGTTRSSYDSTEAALWTVTTASQFVYVASGTNVQIQAAIDSLGAEGGIVYLGPANFDLNATVNVPRRVSLVGSGRFSTQLILKGDFIALELSGTATGVGSHRNKIGLRNFAVVGTGIATTNPMVRAYYINTSLFESLQFSNHVGVAWLSVEMWDCTFKECRWDSCGGNTGLLPTPGGSPNGQPVMLFLNQDNTGNTGFGGSTDTVNELHFINCTWETFRDGGVWMLGDAYTSTRIGGPFNFQQCKWDAVGSANGPAIICTQALQLGIEDLSSSYQTAGSGYAGTAFAWVDVRSTRAFSINGTMKFKEISSVTPVIRSGLKMTGTSYGRVGPLWGLSNTTGAPSTALLEWSGTNDWCQQRDVAWFQAGGTTPAVVGKPTKLVQGEPVAIKAGVPTDADYPFAIPGGPFDGMGPVIDSTTGKAYYRVGGSWVTGSGASPLLGADVVANRPAASGANSGYFFFATDVAGGTLQRSTGSAWSNASVGLSVGASLTPSLLGGHARTASVENGPRWYFTTGATGTTTGRVIFNYLTPDADTSITKLAFATAATAAVGATLTRFGLYTVDGSGNLTLVARTANDTTLFAATATEYSRVLDTTGGYPATYNMLGLTRYAIGCLVVGASTMPSLSGPGSMNTGSGNLAPRVFARLDSQADLPTSVTAGSLVNSLVGFYAAALA